MKRIIFSFLSVVISVVVYSQNQRFIGVSLKEECNYGYWNEGFGASCEQQFCKHGGVELGLNCRMTTEWDQILFPEIRPDVSFTTLTRLYFLSVPVSYKFYSNILNVSTGLVFDYYVGFKDITNDSQLKVNDYNISPRFYAGYELKAGKTIKIAPRLFLEPEVYLNQYFDFYELFLGGSLKIKYQLLENRQKDKNKTH